MARKLIPPNPDFLPEEKRPIYYAELNRILSDSGALLENADLADMTTKPHASLDSVGVADDTDADTVQDKHVSNAQMKAVADHYAATSAHGATGDVVGTGDTATAGTAGVVLQSATQSDATVTVTGSAGATYTATEQGMINALKTDMDAMKVTIDALIDKLQAAGIMA
jgi:hypothetical protein